MTKEHWTQKLIDLGACGEAIAWAKDYNTLDEAWANCTCARWMAWLAGRCAGEPESPARKVLVTALCEIVRGVLHLVPIGEERPRVAIETTEAWARGAMTVQAVREAANAAYAAAYAVAYATYATAYAANAAAYAAAYAADAADATANAATYAVAYADDAYDADACTRVAPAIIMRKHYPKPPTLP